jgi:hypothetical protein
MAEAGIQWHRDMLANIPIGPRTFAGLRNNHAHIGLVALRVVNDARLPNWYELRIRDGQPGHNARWSRPAEFLARPQTKKGTQIS